MLLSIIIPIYNCIEFLPRLSEAVAALRGADFEVILIDDGSVDGSGAMCDDIARNNAFVKVMHKQNGGVSSARNAGLDAAMGEYIGFWDADDLAKPEMYTRLTESAKINGSDMVMGGYEKADGDKQTPVYLPFEDTQTDSCKVTLSMAFWNGWAGEENLPAVYGSVWPNLYKAELISRNNIRFAEDISIGEDLLFNLEYLSCVKKISIVNEPLYVYNVANSSATRRQNKTLWESYRKLLEREERLLKRLYNEDLEYNVHRQRMYYAVNVVEEQICVFYDKKQAIREIKKLCADEKLRESAKYIIKSGKTGKEKTQAALIYGKFAWIIWRWVK